MSIKIAGYKENVKKTLELVQKDCFGIDTNYFEDDFEVCENDFFYGEFLRNDVPPEKELASLKPHTAAVKKPENLQKPAEIQSAKPQKSVSRIKSVEKIKPAEKPKEIKEIMELEEINGEVEDFEEARDDEEVVAEPVANIPNFTFEDPLKGSDLNKLAMKIEFSKQKEEAEDEADELEMDISAPDTDIFSKFVSGNAGKNDDVDKDDDVIGEKNGLIFIKDAAGSGIEEKKLDSEIKTLVNSVLNPVPHGKTSEKSSGNKAK